MILSIYFSASNMLMSKFLPTFFHTPFLRSILFSSVWSQQSIVTYLVPSFLRQIDRDPSRVGTLRLKLRYPFDPAAGSIVVSISFLHLFPLTSWLHVLFLCRGRFLTWIVPHFPTGNPVGSFFRDEKTLNDSDDRSWKSILMTQLFTDAYWFLIESFCSIRSRNCAGIGN